MKHLGSWGPGKFAALVTLVGVTVVLAVRGQGMFSPGALNAEVRQETERGGVRSHAELTNNCAACHAEPWSGGTMSGRCLDCHSEVREQIERKGPMHGLLAQGKECRECHTEHKGAHAGLTDMTTFDHTCTAFPLTGGHRHVDCKSCHTGSVYRGTPTDCNSCHAEPKIHKDRFGADCAGCHNVKTWKFTTGTAFKFNHDFTTYKLTGKHTKVDCKGCHAWEVFVKAGARRETLAAEVFKGTPQNCAACHAEPKTHKSRYGNNCNYCHKTSDWEDVTFRHSFPVNHGGGGGRKGASCATCHTEVKHFEKYTCYGCHNHTPEREAQRRDHRNVSAKNLAKCTTCHPAGRGHVRRTALLGDAALVCVFVSTHGAVQPLRRAALADFQVRALPASEPATFLPPVQTRPTALLPAAAALFRGLEPVTVWRPGQRG